MFFFPPGDFSAGSSFQIRVFPANGIPMVPVTPSEITCPCSPRGCRPAGWQLEELSLLRNRGGGISRRELSRGGGGGTGSGSTAYINGARKLNLFLLAGATTSSKRVEKYVSPCACFSLVIDICKFT